MNAPFDFLPESWLEPLAWALVHSLWQVTLIAVVTGILLALLEKGDARIRYGIGCLALFLCIAIPIGTALSLAETPTSTPYASAWAQHTPSRAPQIQAASEASGDFIDARISFPASKSSEWALADWKQAVQPTLPWLLLIWLLGMGVRAAIFAGGLVRLARLRRRLIPVGGDWPLVAHRLAHRLGIYRPVQLFKSEEAPGPFVMGMLRPMIVMPAAAFTGMSTAELETIILHELAHVRRHDFLVNLLQICAETVLFYHPGVWWLSKRIRTEREHCCDDLAVKACDEALTYAKALTHLEMLRPAPAFALSAGGGPLLTRIRRITGATVAKKTRAPGVSVALVLLAVVMASASLLASPVPAPEAPEKSRVVEWDHEDEDDLSEDFEILARAARDTAWSHLGPSELRPLADCGFDPSLFRALEQAGLAATPRQLRQLGCADVSGEDVTELFNHGFATNIETLVALTRHGIDAEDVLAFRRAGLNLELKEIIELSTHGVDAEEMAIVRRSGYPNLSAREMSKLARHGVDVEDILGLQQAGFSGLTIDDIIGLARHGVDVEDVTAYLGSGLDLGLDDIRKLARHGVDPEDLNEYRRVGLLDITMKEVLTLARHGVDAEDFAEYRRAGLNDLTMADVLTLARHGVDPEDFAGYRRAGLEGVTMANILTLSRHGVDPEDFAGYRHVFGPLSMGDVLALARHGVDPEDADALRVVGPPDLTVQHVVRLSRHGIDAEDVARIRAEDDTATIDDIIRRIHAGDQHHD